MQKDRVLCEVGTEVLYIIYKNVTGLEDRTVSHRAARRCTVARHAGNQFWDVSCGICGGQSGNVTGVSS